MACIEHFSTKNKKTSHIIIATLAHTAILVHKTIVYYRNPSTTLRPISLKWFALDKTLKHGKGRLWLELWHLWDVSGDAHMTECIVDSNAHMTECMVDSNGSMTECMVDSNAHMTECMVDSNGHMTECMVDSNGHMTECMVDFIAHMTECMVDSNAHM